MTKNCQKCGKINENPLIKFCMICYSQNGKQLTKTKIKPISDKKKERLKETGGEKELFRRKIIENEVNGCLVCEVCGKNFLVENAGAYSFAHILNKKDYGYLRLFINNLALVCSIEHHKQLDNIVNKIKKDIGNSELEKLIASGKDIKDLIDKYK